MLVGYMRVSTDDQNLEGQRQALLAAGCTRIFEDTFTGARMDRPGLKEALAYVRNGDVLVIWRLDRLGRSTIGVVTLVQELRARGVAIKSIQDGIDTSSTSAVAQFQLTVLAAFAEMEKAIIVERTMLGMSVARAAGKQIGGKPSLTAQQVEMARAMMRDTNASARDVAKQMGCSVATLYRYLRGGRSALVDDGAPMFPLVGVDPVKRGRGRPRKVKPAPESA